MCRRMTAIQFQSSLTLLDTVLASSMSTHDLTESKYTFLKDLFAIRKELGISIYKQMYNCGSIVLGAAKEPSVRDINAMRCHYGCG